jgi:hypothetical protein
MGTNQSIFLTYRPPVGNMAWAQLGWAKWTYNTAIKQGDGVRRRQWFTEVWYNGGANNYFNSWSDSSVGTNTQFKILWTGGTGSYGFYINGADYFDIGNAPFSPSTADILGETHDVVDQMPGGTNAKTNFYLPRYSISPIWSTWTGVTGAMSRNANTGYASYSTNASTYFIWDSRCSS